LGSLALGILVLAALLIAVQRTPWRARKVVLITIDTLRADRLGVYGYERAPTSPVLDGWAKSAVLFERAFSQAPWTVPSLGSLFTGRFPVEAGVYTNRGGITPDLATLPELFRRQGFETASFNTHALLVNQSGGFRRGFREVFPDAIRPEKRGQHKIPWTDTEPHLMRWLEEHAGEERFFLWIHDMDPHAPPTAGNPYLDKPGWHAYDAEVRWVDEAIGRILAKLDALGIRDELLLVFTADHGEAFGEHGFRGHQDVMYDEVLRVPLILSYPGVERGLRIAQPVPLIDLFATIAELAGLPLPAGTRGESLVPLIERRRGPRRRHQFHSRYHFEDGHHELAVRDDDWKLLLKTPPQSSDGNVRASARERASPTWSLDAPGTRRELFHWSHDRDEKANVLADRPEVVARLEAVLWAWWRRVSAHPGERRREAPELDAAGQEALRALGYE
jgi:arylsulfatase A-like enzyme